VAAARLCEQIPDVAHWLESGKLSLTKLCMLKGVLSADNHAALLEQASRLTEEEVESLALNLDPKRKAPKLRESIKPLAPQTPKPSTALPLLEQSGSVPEPPRSPLPPTQDLHLLQIPVGPEFRARLADVRNALSHSHPGASIEELLLHCMDLALAKQDRAVKGQVQKPRPQSGKAPAGRTIPAAVRRKVWARDEDRCAFVALDGRRCDARARLELHHIKPFALGGPPTVDNIELRCRAHNNLEARFIFGHETMDLFAKHPRPG